MWDTSTPNDGDVWGNRPSDAQGNLDDRDVWGNPPSDSFGNPTPSGGGDGRSFLDILGDIFS
ncbi:MAG: hypothetical protein K2V38_25725 [Gemmataceae bacterium]|nr:hypothetical protein [Gemmataceae bacterium]